MAASDSKWPPLKNAAWRVTFPILDADGDLVTEAENIYDICGFAWWPTYITPYDFLFNMWHTEEESE